MMIGARPMFYQLAAALVAATIALIPGIVTTVAEAQPNFVNLAANQTPIRNQGRRNTCITFGAMAALEAAYNRAGYGQLDLSEQFLNHLGKMTWLHTKWDEVVAKGEDGSEGQVGAFGGGNGAAYVEQLAKGMKVPEESALPYRTTDYNASDHPHLAYRWDDPFWSKQRRMSDFNLDENFLPRAALTQLRYYSVKQYVTVAANDIGALERTLASGREVVWDFRVANTGQRAIIWTPCGANQPNCPRGAHSMLLIGYDRSDADPSKHHFIAKNSWGRTQHPDGFTRLSYDYVRKYGIRAASIVEVERPGPWPELAFIGRWNLNFDGHKGVLDIYHMPGISKAQFDQEGVRIADHRIGSFYDHNGTAYKVNGRISMRQIEFYIDAKNRISRWDQLGGRRFVFSRPAGTVMAGVFTDPDRREYAGFATLGPTFADGPRSPRPFTAQAFLSGWKASFLTPESASGAPGSGMLRLDRLDGSFLSPAERSKFEGLAGELVEAGEGRFEVRALVDKTQTNRNVLRLRRTAPIADTRSYEVSGYHLNHAAGIVAGKGMTPGNDFGFVLVRE